MKRIERFLVFTVLLSVPWWWLSREYGGYGYITLLMWSPAAAAVITLRTTGGSLSELGWRGAKWTWLVGSWLTVLVALLLPNVVVWALSLVTFPDPDGLAAAAKLTAMSRTPATPMLLWYVALVAIAGMIRLAGPALGEELGWRGFLAPEATRRFGFGTGSILTGLAWAVWHLPLVIGKVPPVAVLNFVVTIAGMSIAYSWFRLKSNSVWPPVIMHALHNALLTSVILKLSVPGAAADTWLDETGFALAIAGVIVGAVFLYLGRGLGSPQESTRLEH